MPDFSADRPPVLPEEPFTKEDIDAVRFAIADARFDDGSTEQAVAVLKVLAARSRLLAPSAEHREEIGVRVDVAHPARKEKAGTIMTHFPRENALRAHEIWDGWTVVRRTKIDWAGPWVEVDRSTEHA